MQGPNLETKIASQKSPTVARKKEQTDPAKTHLFETDENTMWLQDEIVLGN